MGWQLGGEALAEILETYPLARAVGRRTFDSHSHAFGDEPFYTSAAIRRILSIAYIIIWAWGSKAAIQSKWVLFDEVEALHPRQGILSCEIKILSPDIELTIATTSPLSRPPGAL
ncbi:MAG: hypothetical protein IPP17_12015 [Bacteroidetes bacterium]|nr:hypothetical protein [Bacteroidota bacterium]